MNPVFEIKLSQGEIRRYGCSEEELRRSLEDSLIFLHGGPVMYVISMLSDAQEMTARDIGDQFNFASVEEQRQLLNRVKWILRNYCQDQEGRS